MRLARMMQAIALQRAKIVGIAELEAQLLEELPVLVLPFFTDLLRQISLQVVGDAVVVDQRVVDVEEKDQALHVGRRHYSERTRFQLGLPAQHWDAVIPETVTLRARTAHHRAIGRVRDSLSRRA